VSLGMGRLAGRRSVLLACGYGAALFALCLLVACFDTTRHPAAIAIDRDTAPPLQTDALIYTLEEHGGSSRRWRSGTIKFEYRNSGDRPIFALHCRGSISIILERQVDDGWERWWGAPQALCLSIPAIMIEPGSVYTDSMIVFGKDLPSGMEVPPGSFDPHGLPEEGIYRLLWDDLRYDVDLEAMERGTAVPYELAVSNPFLLTK
jgi:hypothetical protein